MTQMAIIEPISMKNREMVLAVEDETVKSSMSASFVNRVMMRPVGVVSKKDIGAWSAHPTILS